MAKYDGEPPIWHHPPWNPPNKGKTSGVRNYSPPVGSSIRREPITRPLSKYFTPHETEEYKA